ncbi:MAG TPA: glycosyltransferase [Solirubrobacteraceae bacterium]|nr:glycosyltransferase [Solirubrobacteraceae bacterium]
MPAQLAVIVTAFNEADRLPATLAAVEDAFPGARVVVADDGSGDATQHVALQHGAELVRAPVTIGKGGVATLAAERLLDGGEPPGIVVLCDGDLGDSARELPRLVAALDAGDGADLAIAAFARRVGGGVGAALGFSRWATRALGGVELRAPISGQRAVRGGVLPALLPFAPRFGMETAMNIDAARAGFRITEVELDLEHRATGKTLRGFLHRARQLADFAAVYVDRR